MSIDIRTEKMRSALLFKRDVLFTPQYIPREDIPEGWYRYELGATVRNAKKPVALKDHASVNRVGCVLSPVPLKKPDTISRRLNGQFLPLGETLTLREFCRNNGLEYPFPIEKFTVRPASPEEAGLFYALPPEKDEELGVIGHVRIDFGHGGTGFWHTWWPRGPEELNTPEFKGELGQVMDELRLGVLRDLASMRRYCRETGGEISGGVCGQNYGYVVETEHYRYCLRCNPVEGNYQAYLTCFDLRVQQMGLTEKGREMLQDAADTEKPHDYRWYVIENINGGAARVDHELPLEEAVQLYAGLDCADKRLGVTKDGVASVDMAVCLNGRERVYDDWQKLDSFAQDPVVAEAADLIRQTLEEQAVGRISFANGEQFSFTDPQKYLEAIREELPYYPTTGFRYETLTSDPEVRRAVDAELYDLYGMEPPGIADEEQQSGAPIEAQQSGFDGERSRSEMSELSLEAEANDMELAATMGGMSL